MLYKDAGNAPRCFYTAHDYREQDMTRLSKRAILKMEKFVK
jgi:hypothetical protein